jgi:hypothetical protein
MAALLRHRRERGALDVNGDGDVAVVGTFSGTLDPDGLGAQGFERRHRRVRHRARCVGHDRLGSNVRRGRRRPWRRSRRQHRRGDHVSGSFRGTLQLDALSASAGSQADLFVAKLTPTQAIWLEQLENGSPEPTLFVSVKNANGPIVGAGSWGTLDPDGPGPRRRHRRQHRRVHRGFETDGTRTFSPHRQRR